MYLPNKHITVPESLFGFGGYLAELLKNPRTIDELWARYVQDRESGKYSANHSFENLVLSLDALFAIGAIDWYDELSGELRRCV
jgi:hypothetical protein